MRKFSIFIGMLAIAFVGLSASGYLFSKPGEPILRFKPCYKGTEVAFGFGGTYNFLRLRTEMGEDYSKIVVRGYGWPGGFFALTTLDLNICPGASMEEVEHAVVYRYLRHPELFPDSRPINMEDVEENCIVPPKDKDEEDK